MKKGVLVFFAFLIVFTVSLAAIRTSYFGSITGYTVSEKYSNNIRPEIELFKEYKIGLSGIIIFISLFIMIIILSSVKIYKNKRTEALVHQLR